jgi:hypothetical protein
VLVRFSLRRRRGIVFCSISNDKTLAYGAQKVFRRLGKPFGFETPVTIQTFNSRRTATERTAMITHEKRVGESDLFSRKCDG